MTTTDLIARLRYTAEHGLLAAIDAGMDADPALGADALERMRDALEPLAKVADSNPRLPSGTPIYVNIDRLRDARAALEKRHD